MVENGERVAQFVLKPSCLSQFTEAKELSSTDRGDGGFGSSGTKEVKKRERRADRNGTEEW